MLFRSLRKESAWPKERIAKALEQTKPTQANLKSAIPVFMLYNTVTVDEAGQVHFWKDVYGLISSIHGDRF